MKIVKRMKIGKLEIIWTHWNSWQWRVIYGPRRTTYAVGPFDIDIIKHKEKS